MHERLQYLTCEELCYALLIMANAKFQNTAIFKKLWLEVMTTDYMSKMDDLCLSSFVLSMTLLNQFDMQLLITLELELARRLEQDTLHQMSSDTLMCILFSCRHCDIKNKVFSVISILTESFILRNRDNKIDWDHLALLCHVAYEAK